MSFLIDMIILALLAGTLIYAFLVDRRVRMLMAALRDMQPLVANFSEAVDRSEKSVTQMKTMATDISEPRRTHAAPEARSEPATLSFRSVRDPQRAPTGVARLRGKSDLVRGFFETAQRGV
ncbi:flagellar motor switch protein [Pseudooceanicola nanhaiensis]|uniref:flagellar motor switch protein n=1 Tax=Pseudooceanicola nanhaiensis TaxID=375761 RepID=UPI001CD7CA94|nr:flagellar motor switch protein [Pseudooceanicola nanhaiensis]MCA0922638.1 flagellar motor switch protein [Pseudooceanicola nanhaiensis]